MIKKKTLGKGLETLLQGARLVEEVDAIQQASTHGTRQRQDHLRQVPIEWVERGRYQPRRDMNPEALEELASSIRQQGVLQPIVVRPSGQPGEEKYEIVAGERRWRASQLAGLDSVPVIVKDISDEAAVAVALIENIQREDLNAVEEALALERLKNEFDMTQQQVAEAVGKSREAVANLLRILSLQSDVRRMLEHGDLELGHAKVLLSLPGEKQLEVGRMVVSQGLSVRQTEALVRRIQRPGDSQAKARSKDPDVRSLEENLSRKVGAPVVVKHASSGKGQLVIRYNSLDELDGILAHIQ